MKSVREILGRIWSIFRRNGIADDLIIIQYIADLLVGAQPEQDETIQRAPSKINPAIRFELDTLLGEAAGLAGGNAKLFNQHVVFNLPNILAGGRYPTPRHLIACMHRLAMVRPKHSLVDIACGSGGFLVNEANDSGASFARRVGVEISNDWAHIARVNAKLHGIEATILNENALVASAPGGILQDEEYDRILMNPPFGELMDPSLVQELASKKIGLRSEVVLANLALSRLAKDGKAAIMVPQRVLFAKGAESALRQRLVEDFHLEAVVELPRDALQPYSNVQSHILLIGKHSPSSVAPTWFFRVEDDGYPSGRARDLTESPSGPSDLPFIEAIFRGEAKTRSESSLLQVEVVNDNKGERFGLIVRAVGVAKLVSASELREKRGHWVVVTVEAESEKSLKRSTHWISLDTGGFASVENPESIFKSGLTESLLQEGTKVVAVAISLQDMRLLGVAVESETLRASGSYDLRLDEYLTRPVQKIVDASPAEILARVRTSQQRLATLLDELSGQLELTPIANQRFPPPLEQTGEAPFGALSAAQREVWKKILRKTENWTEDNSQYETAVHFTATEVDPTGTEAAPSTRATLSLFEQMGVIVAVTITPLPRKEPAVVYRRTTQRDLWTHE